VEKAPTETYADVGGLEQQIQEIKEAVELPLTHPELYEDIGIKPPKVRLHSRAGFVSAFGPLPAGSAPQLNIHINPARQMWSM
jgi:hypothetical protein